MTDIIAAQTIVMKIHEAAVDGQNGSAAYALDRLLVIKDLAATALSKLDTTLTDLERAGAGGMK